MVNKEIVEQTIKKMKDSGIDDSAIKQTLRDVGLSEQEIEAYLPSQPTESESKPAPNPEHEAIAEKTAEKVNQYISQQTEEHALREQTSKSDLDNHSNKIDELHEKVQGVSEKIESISTESSAKTLEAIRELNKRVSSLESQISEIKSISNATKSLMEKVLETDRKVLSKL